MVEYKIHLPRRGRSQVRPVYEDAAQEAAKELLSLRSFAARAGIGAAARALAAGRHGSVSPEVATILLLAPFEQALYLLTEGGV